LNMCMYIFIFFFSSRRRHTRSKRDWSSDVCSSDLNVLYLISHALVETGNGKSELAKGIEDNGKKYYNFFGIGAFDENAVHTGSSFAKKQAWTSPDKAIMGGAQFVRNNYFNNKQISLYQMRWN